MILKGIVGLLSPGGLQARLSILIFHRVLTRQDPLFPDEPDTIRFDEILRWVGNWFHVLPLDGAIVQLGAGTLPARAAAITFDDGYADNAFNALPILKRHGMSATFFVATSFLNGGRMWNDTLIEAIRGCKARVLDLEAGGLGHFNLGSIEEKRLAINALLVRIKHLEPVKRDQAVAFVQSVVGVVLRKDLMMTSHQVIGLRDAGMQIGAHTCTHPILAKLSDREALAEITNSKAVLEDLLNEPVSLFAYPNGKLGTDYLSKHALMARQAGFAAAVTTAPGVSLQNTDPFQLPRFSPWDRTKLRYGARLILNMRAATQPAA